MPKPWLTLWLLNRVVEWDPEPLVEALSNRFQVRLGRRVVASTGAASTIDVAVNATGDGRPGELMFEKGGTTSFDEYFVPIPIKCVGELGSPFWSALASPGGKARLAELQQHLARRFPSARTLRNLRQVLGNHFGQVKMNTARTTRT